MHRAFWSGLVEILYLTKIHFVAYSLKICINAEGRRCEIYIVEHKQGTEKVSNIHWATYICVSHSIDSRLYLFAWLDIYCALKVSDDDCTFVIKDICSHVVQPYGCTNIERISTKNQMYFFELSMNLEFPPIRRFHGKKIIYIVKEKT